MNFSAVRFQRTSFLVGAIAAICAFATHAQAQTIIYQDNFSGVASDDLGTTLPAVNTTGEGWRTAFGRQNGGSDNNSAQIFNADGSIVKDGPNSTHDAGALLPLTVASNTVYTLEATVLNNNSSWIAVGFASADATLDGSNGRHSNPGAGAFGGYAWALTRNNDGNDQEIFNGIGTGEGSVVAGDLASPSEAVTIQVVLDTSNVAAPTASYFLNGAQVGSTETLPAEAFTNISFVGISSDGNAGDGTATITSFTLSSAPGTGPLLGDVSLDGTVDFDDISPFITVLANGTFQAEADIDGSTEVDFDDIAGFIEILAGP